MKTGDEKPKVLALQDRAAESAQDQTIEESLPSSCEPLHSEQEKLAVENQLLNKKLVRIEADLKALQTQHTSLQVRFLKTLQQQLDQQTSNISQSRRKIVELVGLAKRSAANR